MKRLLFIVLAVVAVLLAGCNGKKADKQAKDTKLEIRPQATEPQALKPSELKLDANSEDLPQFPGGFDAMRSYIKSHVRMPEAARTMKKEGKVIVSAEVDDKGNITSCEVFSSDDAVFDEEALRVVRSMPQFTPARKGGKAVSSECKIAVVFRFN